MKGVAVILLVLVAMVQFMAMPSEAISCSEVSSALSPCVSYLISGGTPSGNCCSGVKNLTNMLSTKQDRQTACGCAKAAAARYPALKPDAASSLPGKCGVTMNVPISPNTNCNDIQ